LPKPFLYLSEKYNEYVSCKENHNSKEDYNYSQKNCNGEEGYYSGKENHHHSKESSTRKESYFRCKENYCFS